MVFVFFLILSLLLLITKQLTPTTPTWQTSGLMISDTVKIVDGDCMCIQGNIPPYPTATVTFSTAFAIVPYMAFGVVGYEGNDGLSSQSIQLAILTVTELDFNIQVTISGVTNLWVLELQWIAINRFFPNHINVFNNVPIEYNNGGLINISTASPTIQTYQNTINYTLQATAMGSSYTLFTMPLSNIKIVLFITTFEISGTVDTAGMPYYPLNLSITASPTTIQTYTITATYGINSALTKLNFDIIIYDLADVLTSNLYTMVSGQQCMRTNTGGLISFSPQFRTNFIYGLISFTTSRTETAIHYATTFSPSGMFMLSLTNSRVSLMPVPTELCFSYFYLKTYACPTSPQSAYDSNTDMCTCPTGCQSCVSMTMCTSCDFASNYVLNTGFMICQQCDTAMNLFASTLTGNCQPCSIINCLTCSSLFTCSLCDYTSFYYASNDELVCLYCNSSENYFINSMTHLCQACIATNCIQCASLTTCSVCNISDGYYLNTTTNLCQVCSLVGCVQCNTLTTCQKCNNVTHFIDTSSQCQVCTIPNCILCLTLSVCKVCDVANQYYFSAGSCQTCSLAGCVRCASLTTCQQCDNVTRFIDTSSRCQVCTLSNCLTCSSLTACSTCNVSNGYFLNTTSLHCEPCSLTGCVTCTSLTVCQTCNTLAGYGFDYTSTNMSKCGPCPVSCICNGYGLPWRSSENKCTPLCGDGMIRLQQQCDDNNTISGDGCSPTCTIQTNYICSGEPSICNQTSPIQASLISTQKIDCNKLKITINKSSFPNVQLSQNIFIVNTGVTIVSKVQNSSFIEITAQYTADILNQTIILQVSPAQQINITYAPDIPALYYTPQQCSVTGQVKSMIQTSQYISYAILVGSLFSQCSIIGLQLFGVLQLSYTSLSMQSYLNIYSQPLTQFSTFNGYNIKLFNQTTQLPNNLKKLGLYSSFINNCNVMIFLMFGNVAIGFSLVLISSKLNLLAMKKISLRILKQGSITLILFNISNISFSAGVHWKYASPQDDGYVVSSLVMYTTLVAVAVSVIAMQATAKKDYGQLKNKYKFVWVCQAYVPFTICYKFLLGLYSSLSNQNDESALINIAFSLIFLFYFLINLPFINVFENYRGALIQVTSNFTLFSTNYFSNIQSNTPIQIKGKIYGPTIVQLVLLMGNISSSAFVLAYQIFKLVKKWKMLRSTMDTAQPNNKYVEQSFQNLSNNPIISNSIANPT